MTRHEFARACGVSDDVMGRLDRYLHLLLEWQKAFNLVGAKTLQDPWRRHFLDSAQLRPVVGDTAGAVADLGTGAGFPGLVLSLLGRQDLHLIDSDANKAEFLRQVIRQTGASATIHRTTVADYDGPRAATVVARACAPLDTLLGYAAGVSGPGARAVFLKGRSWRDELTRAQALWHVRHRCHQSLTNSNGVILEVHEFKRR